jgi:hypothetical protein
MAHFGQMIVDGRKRTLTSFTCWNYPEAFWWFQRQIEHCRVIASASTRFTTDWRGSLILWTLINQIVLAYLTSFLCGILVLCPNASGVSVGSEQKRALREWHAQIPVIRTFITGLEQTPSLECFTFRVWEFIFITGKTGVSMLKARSCSFSTHTPNCDQNTIDLCVSDEDFASVSQISPIPMEPLNV